MTQVWPVTFRVWGHPEPEGSMKIVPDYSRRHRIKRRAGATDQDSPEIIPGRLINNNQTELDHWRGLVKQAAQMHISEPLSGPVRMHCLFLLQPRKGDSRHKRMTTLPDVKPDGDKLLRSIGDALKGIAYIDDGRITTEIAQKRWAVEDRDMGVIITLQPDVLPGMPMGGVK